MIVEFFKHLTTPAPPAVKKLGFVAGAIAIEARFNRQYSHWQHHLEKTKQIIIDEVSKLPEGAHILVLGAGGLFDLPFENIINGGKNLSLLDIVYLRSTRKKVRSHANIKLIEGDITNYVADFYAWMLEPTKPMPTPVSPMAIEKLITSKPDLVISLNILSQLPLQFEQKVAKLKPNFNFDEIANMLMEQHIRWLKALNCPVLVVGDIERNLISDYTIADTEVIIATNSLDQPFDTWVWDIAPKGEIHKDMSFSHKVGAWRLN